MSEFPGPEDLTSLLRRYEGGDAVAGEALIAALYDDLRRIAARQLSRERPDHTLQPTALLHEAWMRIGGGQERDIPSRDHFLALASRVMRSLLVDHARATKAEKRGGSAERLSLQSMSEADTPASFAMNASESTIDILALDDALAQLESVDAELARLVELRYFAGSTVDEAARALGLAQRTAERRLRAATAWLRKALDEEPES